MGSAPTARPTTGSPTWPIANPPLQREKFADGVLTDTTGKRRVFYHGTVETFAEFDRNKAHDRDGTALQLGLGPGLFYFSDHPDDAFRYAIRRTTLGANVRPVHLVMRQPLVIRRWDDSAAAWRDNAARGYASYARLKTYVARMRQWHRDLRAYGYDGIITEPDGTPGEYAVFDPTQIVSIFRRQGPFSNPSDPVA